MTSNYTKVATGDYTVGISPLCEYCAPGYLPY